ncbi:MAG: hypothetical protein WC045_03900 [Patescibacteria group bacterium]
MNRKEVINKIEEFRQTCKEYSKLLLDSRDSVVPEIVRNHDSIDEAKADLSRSFAFLEEYIIKFGNNPRMSDGVWNVTYSPYSNAFSTDTLVRVAPSLDRVVDDLNIVLGRIEATTDSEFAEKMNPLPQNSSGESDSKEVTINDIEKPHKEYWNMVFASLMGWARSHVSTVIAGVIITLIAGFLLFKLGWN